MGGKRRGKGEREGRKGTEEGPTNNSWRGAQNVKLRHWYGARFDVVGLSGGASRLEDG